MCEQSVAKIPPMEVMTVRVKGMPIMAYTMQNNRPPVVTGDRFP